MDDPALQALLPILLKAGGKTLWVADENALAVVQSVVPSPDLFLVSNRYDVMDAALRAGHQAQFSDFDFSTYEERAFERIVFRIAKEKPVNHHVLNNAFRLLAVGGELFVAGLKNEGIKTCIGKTGKLFGDNLQGNRAIKYGMGYLGHFTKGMLEPAADCLDDQQYTSLRLVETPVLDFYSKPGLFGWDKIDQGSAFLVEHLPEFLAQLRRPPESMLDLGCGYGYLTLMTRQLPLVHRVATDNNAAALLAIQHNVAHYGMDVEVVAGDAGSTLSGSFDMILCNPPFHQGFSVDVELTEKFLRNTRRLLTPQGSALFVVNAFIGIEKIAGQYFNRVGTLAHGGAFKLVMMEKEP